ncbi:ABC transporter ATP-binding protein [Haliea sp. E17]|uniref:ABC transporter ATP-binding protein n=1 Tax=Haliea sp. E17 TaxID=3401576 RepID=UPI003AAD9198
MSEPAVRARGLSRRFGEVLAVDNIDLDIPHGQIFGFLGPNGSGKTTTIRVLCGLLTPSSGEVTVLGKQIPAEAEAVRRRIGYMTQKFSLYEDLSIEENLNFVGSIQGLGRRARHQRIAELLQQFDLEDLRKRRADAMSGGQRQRLALAAATIHRPDLLFLDEPTSAVDPENRRDFWEKLFDLLDTGTSILVSTHYMDEAERCHQLAILDRGRLRLEGSPAELMGALDRRVVEIDGSNLRKVKDTALALPQVESAAQQGLRLRVLMQDGVDDPVSYLRSALDGAALEIHPARPSLEDVFVAATLSEPPEKKP